MPPVDTSQLLGETVRELRLERDMTQQQLADFCRIDRSFLISLEKGRANTSARTLVLIAAAFGIRPSELFRRFSNKVMKGIAAEQRKPTAGATTRPRKTPDRAAAKTKKIE
jgi:transcriptional regulator with XRE-family HTH domain